jgi:4-amino-4-deoxy-L-arabinose transferase-like glycosyltransferase
MSRPLLLLGVLPMLGGVLLFFDAGARVFSSNDEARFPVMAQDILASGHWLLPEISGTPMLNKPPLQAWLIALVSWPENAVTQWTAVLPSIVAALGVVLLTAWFGARYFDLTVGVVGGLVLLTMVGVFDLARSPVPDMTLTLAISLAMAAFAAWELEARRWALIVFYGLTGVACWAKGPAGLLPLAAALTCECIVYGWRGAGRLASPYGLALLAALVAPWWVLAARRGGAVFTRDVVVTDMLLRYFTLEGSPWRRIGQPFGQAVTALLPWSVVLPFVLWPSAADPDSKTKPASRLLLVWAATVFLLTALLERQRLRYYLPLCPPLALVVAVWISRVRSPQRTALFAALWIVIATSFAIGETVVVARRERGTNFRQVLALLASAPAPVFATDAPDIVSAFYLGRPVVVLPSLEAFAHVTGPGYLITSQRQADRATFFRRVATCRVEGRTYVLLRKQP